MDMSAVAWIVTLPLKGVDFYVPSLTCAPCDHKGWVVLRCWNQGVFIYVVAKYCN